MPYNAFCTVKYTHPFRAWHLTHCPAVVERTCRIQPPGAQVVKFKALHCDGFVKPSDCAITCAPGYNSKDNSIFKICKEDGGKFELIGCTPNIDTLLNKFTHTTPCWKISECLMDCLSNYKNKDEIQCYDSCLCRAGRSPPCRPPTCIDTLNLDVAKFPAEYTKKLRRHIDKQVDGV